VIKDVNNFMFGLEKRLSFKTINRLIYIVLIVLLIWLIYYSTHVFPGVYE
jgi:hypothetical protein